MDAVLRASYDREGYVIIQNLVPASSLESLTAATSRVIALTRTGQWQHRRTVGKQFPPYDASNPDSWGVQHLMHPQLGELDFVRWYTSDVLVDAVKALLDCDENDLQMELFNLLINPKDHNFALRWHRDDVRELATEQEERMALSVPHYGVQWNTALCDDTCLYVVPNSHLQPRTEEQRLHSSTQGAPRDPLDMPGAVQVRLRAGETVFYNSNILHCARYDCHSLRVTLHGCMGDARGGNRRARNILQHDLEWMKEDEFVKSLPAGRAHRMWERLLEMARGAGGTREYSLQG